MSFPTVAWSDVPRITGSQMQQLIMLATGKYGLDSRLLVEHTARNLVQLSEALAPEGTVLVVAGRGNNGSGGLAAARLLAARGRRVWVVPDARGRELLRHPQGAARAPAPLSRASRSAPASRR
jgi:NAD(P)H-hydrate epimerase